ncbi:MAG: translation initiation factor IF-2 [candidate division Zixibacteria bacterium]|nr:translation initiation factor IF-2 [candidate division Zixibacteria bacterium]
MAKKRVYQLARDYKISSEAMLTTIRELGFEIKSHMSAVDNAVASAIEEKFRREKEAVKKEYAQKKKKLKEREEKEEQKVESKPTVKSREAKLRRKERFRKLEKKRLEARKRRPTFFRGKLERRVDKAEVEQSVKKTLASMDAVKRVRRHKRKLPREQGVPETQPANILRVSEFISVAELANLMEVKPTQVISKCLELGFVASINQRLDMDTIETVALEFGFTVEPVKEIGLEGEEEGEPEGDLVPRPPVITIMGHVDHGKTSLLDYIRKSNIIAGESGGITQHIGAYEVEVPGGKITFLDTPGHEAFTAMRARGAQVTDIVVLVVAADDSVMPQTVEAVDHARAAGVPIIVAINKMDLPQAKSEPIKQELAKLNLVPEEWGGSTILVEISAKTGAGVHKLLEMILLQAEMMELKSNAKRRASGAVIESELSKGRGVVATVLVEKGTLRIGEPFVTGPYHGRVRAMFNERGNPVVEAGPSAPVQVLGASGVPQAGDTFMVTKDETEAREIAAKRMRLKREQDLRRARKASLSEMYEQIEEGRTKELKLILKGDVGGSVEALSDALEKISTSEVKVAVIHRGVGSINESDVLLAAASNAIIIGFHVRPDLRARELAPKEDVDIRLYDVIYEIESDVRKALEGLLEPEVTETVSGTAEVKDVFKISGVGQVAGCLVQEGSVKRGDKVRVIRNGVVVYEGMISSLKRFKDDAKEVSSGMECGIKVEDYNDVKVGDLLETYQIEELARKLE